MQIKRRKSKILHGEGHRRTSFTTYETSAVPTSILVDGEGRICRLNARGGWLDGVLEEIYGK